MRFLTEESDVRQFLDIGTGIPSADNTHEVAQAIAPESRVVYVDNDPMVLVHARALLTSDPAGATAYLDADLRDPEKILADAQLHATLDLSRPVALVLVAVTHFLTDDDRPTSRSPGCSTRCRRAVGCADAHHHRPHPQRDHRADDRRNRLWADEADEAGRGARDRAEFARFFTGLDLAEPGIVPVTEWRPQAPAEQRPPLADASIYGAVARKP
ncbi:SAM-dependent methyltransferase [Micromonospora sp. M12]